jgi:hypothetical protein
VGHDTWKRTPEDWQGAQREVRAHLIATARRRSVTTYLEIHGSISSTVIPSTGNAFGDAIGVLLGHVNLIESRRLGKPMMLSAVAVNKDLRPAAGFQRVLKQMEWEGDWPTWLARVWKTYTQLK